jgi:hypothetical protein
MEKTSDAVVEVFSLARVAMEGCHETVNTNTAI